MKREFLQNFQVAGQSLPKEVIDAIMAENGRDIEAAKAHAGGNGGSNGEMFTQEQLNKIISERLAREREKPVDDEREKALKAREARLDCRDYLDSKKYPAALLDVLDSSDVDKFKAAVDAMVGKFPAVVQPQEVPPPYAAGTGTGQMLHADPVADAFKPPKT